MILTFEPGHLRAIARLAESAARRRPTYSQYHGWHVDFRPGEGAWAVATDGYIMLAAPAVDNNETSTEDPRHATYAPLPGLRPTSARYRVDISRHEICREGTTTVRALSQLRGAHPFPPNWREIALAPTEPAADKRPCGRLRFMFDPELLAPIARDLRLPGDGPVYVTLDLVDPYEPMLVGFSKGENVKLICKFMGAT